MESINGLQFILEVIYNGASAILCEKLPAELSSVAANQLGPNTKEVVGWVASQFYYHQSREQKIDPGGKRWIFP
ncbi:MAG: hypothetical protein H6581_05405 [Bacteroidia bacterium]|nr:hypothetical protein [Bacteroidia bacterium]